MRIETESGKTQFRIGEAIGITLTVEASSPESWNMLIPGRDRIFGLGNEFLTYPVYGTRDPMSYREGEPQSLAILSGQFPYAKVSIAHADLNQWIRFERPGTYEVLARFAATSRGSSRTNETILESNEMALEIIAAEPEWQTRQLHDSVETLKTVKVDNQTYAAVTNAARQIGYLDTPDAVREAAALLSDGAQGVDQILQAGLLASTHRDAAVSVMSELMRGPDQPVTRFSLETLAELEVLHSSVAPAQRFEAKAAALQHLRAELSILVAQKRGTARVITINTVTELQNAPR